jgi:hypothetical protein
MEKKFIYLGLFVGSAFGGYLPSLWGAGVLSMSGIFLSAGGGLAGIWLGYKLGKNF